MTKARIAALMLVVAIGAVAAAVVSADVPPLFEDDLPIANDGIAATLTLKKTVANDDGGTAVADDFQAYIDGQAVEWGVAQTLDAGSYTVSEDTASGYQAGLWGGDCDTNGTVILGPGEIKTCMITNYDIPATLTLEKIVVNNDGGTAVADDFQAYIDSMAVDWGVAQTLDAGSYTVSEDVLSGYQAAHWSRDCDADGNVTLQLGDNKLCIMVNHDVPDIPVGGVTVAVGVLGLVARWIGAGALLGLFLAGAVVIAWRR